MQWLTTVLLPSISSLDSRGTMKSVVNDSIWHDGEVGVRGSLAERKPGHAIFKYIPSLESLRSAAHSLKTSHTCSPLGKRNNSL